MQTQMNCLIMKRNDDDDSRKFHYKIDDHGMDEIVQKDSVDHRHFHDSHCKTPLIETIPL